MGRQQKILRAEDSLSSAVGFLPSRRRQTGIRAGRTRRKNEAPPAAGLSLFPRRAKEREAENDETAGVPPMVATPVNVRRCSVQTRVFSLVLSGCVILLVLCGGTRHASRLLGGAKALGSDLSPSSRPENLSLGAERISKRGGGGPECLAPTSSDAEFIFAPLSEAPPRGRLPSSPSSAAPSPAAAGRRIPRDSASPPASPFPSGSSAAKRQAARDDAPGGLRPLRDAPFLLEKAPVDLSSPADFLALLPFRPRGGAPQALPSALPSFLLVSCARNGLLAVRPARSRSPGAREPLAAVATGHEAPVVALAAFERHPEDGFVATLDASGELRVHSVVTRAVSAPLCGPPEAATGAEEPNSLSAASACEKRLEAPWKLGGALGLRAAVSLAPDVLVRHAFLAVTGSRKITSFAVISHKGEKLFLLGDSEGWITVLSRTGTLRRRVKVTDEEGGVRHVTHQSGVVVFCTARSFAVFSVAVMDATGAVGGVDARAPISAIALDPTRQTRLAVALEDGQVLLYDLKKAALLHKLSSSSRVPLSLVFLKHVILAFGAAQGEDSFLMGFDPKAAEASRSVVRDGGASGAAFLSAERFSLDNFQVGSVASSSRIGDMHLVAALSLSGDEIRLFEPVSRHGLPPEEESWTNFRLPILVIALVAILVFRTFRTRRLSVFKPRDEPDKGGFLPAAGPRGWARRPRADDNFGDFHNKKPDLTDSAILALPADAWLLSAVGCVTFHAKERRCSFLNGSAERKPGTRAVSRLPQLKKWQQWKRWKSGQKAEEVRRQQRERRGQDGKEERRIMERLPFNPKP
ncbi:hypothetical protein BESB_081420 [Besnoitia besnoiti]|uniref:Transmembrane protein n=1 Tax=Besnoitia besnoiti TaxID=94643 RepID=A0A2A9MB89_BESBE|nr:hypothetical protein BESB_081420 [Besnoitia besnoiti]PFH32943.1 hypothetical protein BESB_081420 [Besnoitia besnoiti]